MKVKHKIRKNIISVFAIVSITVLCLTMISPLASADSYWPLHSGMTADITFSGRSWWIADWNTYSPSYVSVDSNGWLHLKQHGSIDSCVFTYDVCGYGTYQYVMANGIKYIDKNAVIGMFAYRSNLTTGLAYQEPDIEQAKWGNEAGTNFDFIIQPNSAHLQNYFTMPYGSSDTTFVIDWEPHYTQFFILDTLSGNVLKTWNVNNTRDSTGVFGVINIWHYLHPTTLDTNIIIKSFTYQANHIYQPPNLLKPPVINSNPITSAIQGKAYSYDVNATNNPTYSLIVKPSGMTVNSASGLISWYSPSYGDQPVTVRATNVDGNIDQTFTIHVSETPQKPIFTSTPITTGIKGNNYIYQISASPAISSYTVSGIDGISVSSSGVVSFVPQSIGTSPIVLKAVNADGSTWQNYTLTISNPTVTDTIKEKPLTNTIVTNPVTNTPFVPDYGTYGDMSNQAGAIGTLAFAVFAVILIPAIVYGAIKKRR